MRLLNSSNTFKLGGGFTLNAIPFSFQFRFPTRFALAKYKHKGI